MSSAIRMDIIHQAARDVAAAPHGQAGDVYDRAAALLNLSPTRTIALVAQAARDLGLAAPRKRRSDAGRSVLTAAHLALISGVMVHDRRAGKWMLGCQEAIDILWDSGRLEGLAERPTAGTVLRQMRAQGLHPEQLSRPTPHVPMRTEHVNQVWQMDFSTTVLVKARNTGELALLDTEGEIYKNKLDNYVRVMDSLLTRAVITEHASGAIAARFCLGGESTENALEALMWAMSQRQDESGAPMPFHGVPFVIYTDQGSAFKSAPWRNFCSAMDIRHKMHAPRNSRATGQVENAQNLFERSFEGRLRFMDTASITVARLNALAELWMHGYCGSRVHSRHGMTRYAAWATIGTEHLRLAPPMDVMRALPASAAKPRTVQGDLSVSFAWKNEGSRQYDLRPVPGVNVGDKVFVTVNPFALPNVRVGVTDAETGEINWHEVAPLAAGFMGYNASAPVLGQEYKAPPTTPAQERRAAVDAQAFARADESGQLRPATSTEAKAAQAKRAAPYQGQFDAMADIKAKAAALPTFLQRPGTPAAIEGADVTPFDRVLNHFEAARELKAMGAEMNPERVYQLRAWFPDGVPESELANLQHRLTVRAGLRVVAGGAANE